MKRSRSFAFNPEKFLAAEQKKSVGFSPSLEELLPIGFSKPFKKKFIERLKKEAPAAFYRGAERSKIDIAMKTLSVEVIRELKMLSIAPDAALVELLIIGVFSEPLWRRITREKNG